MSGIDIKSFNNADEVTDKFNNAKIEAVKVGDQRVVKLHIPFFYSPGFLKFFPASAALLKVLL